jgi:hypothetical protein
VNHLQNNLQNNARNLENMRTGDRANPVAFGLAVGPDTGHKAPAPLSITPDAIRNLREFLDACGWKLIYGLNLGTGTAEDAADELIAFQLCKQPDLFFRNGIRKADYDFKQFAVEWQQFYQTIRTRRGRTTRPTPPSAEPLWAQAAHGRRRGKEVLTVGNGVAVLDLPAASAVLITFERE